MPADLILRTYESESLSIDVAFTSDAFFNATAAAEPFGKRPNDWLSLDSTKAYLSALCDILRNQESRFLNVVRGGRGRADATWMHPDLAVPFCRWLDIHFAVWCDQQIKDIVQGRNPASANDTYRYHSLLLRSLRELARAEDGFGRTLADRSDSLPVRTAGIAHARSVPDRKGHPPDADGGVRWRAMTT